MNPENRDGAANAYTRIYDVVRRIPAGKVATYGQVALLAGNPRWARVVGYALHVNPRPGRHSLLPGGQPHGRLFGCVRVRRQGASPGAAAPRRCRAAARTAGVDLARCQWDGKSRALNLWIKRKETTYAVYFIEGQRAADKRKGTGA